VAAGSSVHLIAQQQSPTRDQLETDYTKQPVQGREFGSTGLEAKDYQQSWRVD
jgi:hypothetical protein